MDQPFKKIQRADELKPLIKDVVTEKIKENFKNQRPLTNPQSPLNMESRPEGARNRDQRGQGIATRGGKESTRTRQQKVAKRVNNQGQAIEAPRLAQEERPQANPLAKAAVKKGVSSMAKLYLPVGSVIAGGAGAGLLNWFLG